MREETINIERNFVPSLSALISLANLCSRDVDAGNLLFQQFAIAKCKYFMAESHLLFAFLLSPLGFIMEMASLLSSIAARNNKLPSIKLQ